MSPLAELKTQEGPVLIQERRQTSRDVSSRSAQIRDRDQGAIASSREMMGLGGLIIIGVLVGSFTTKYDVLIGHRGGALAIPAVGYLALQIFLARGAFRLWEDVRTIPTLGDFVVSRSFRYLPATLPAVLIGFVLLKTVGLSNLKADVASLPANLLLVADMMGVPDIDAAHWRIKIEIMQAALAAMAWFGPFRRNVAMLLTAGLIATAVFMDGEPMHHNVLTVRGLMTSDGYLPFFAFGIALSELTRSPASRLWLSVLMASGVLAALSNTPTHGVCILGALAVLSALVFGHLKVIGRWQFLNRLGEIAFPVYVIHYLMGFIIIDRLERLGCPDVVAILIASSIALFVGDAINRFIERPLQTHGPAAIKIAYHRLAPFDWSRAIVTQG